MKKLELYLICLFTLFSIITTFGQNTADKELDVLLNKPIEKAHEFLLDNGFEIAHSSIFNKKQRWYNEDRNACISFRFDDQKPYLVNNVFPDKEKKCVRGVRQARQIWANYINGMANVNSTTIDNEREQLQNKGYEVSYWIRDVSPGKTAEVWYNESEQLCKMLVWDNSSRSNLKVQDRDPRLGPNPAPVYDVSNI